jgi:hypothetical protein
MAASVDISNLKEEDQVEKESTTQPTTESQVEEKKAEGDAGNAYWVRQPDLVEGTRY